MTKQGGAKNALLELTPHKTAQSVSAQTQNNPTLASRASANAQKKNQSKAMVNALSVKGTTMEAQDPVKNVR